MEREGKNNVSAGINECLADQQTGAEFIKVAMMLLATCSSAIPLSKYKHNHLPHKEEGKYYFGIMNLHTTMLPVQSISRLRTIPPYPSISRLRCYQFNQSPD